MKRFVLLFLLFTIILAFGLVLPGFPGVHLFPAHKAFAGGYYNYTVIPVTSGITKVYCGSIGYYELKIKNTSSIHYDFQLSSPDSPIIAINPSWVHIDPNMTSTIIKITYRMPATAPLGKDIKIYFKINLNFLVSKFFYFQAHCLGNDNCNFGFIRGSNSIPELCPGQISSFTFKIKNTGNKQMYFKWEKMSESPITKIEPTSLADLAAGSTSGTITITCWMPGNIQTGQLATYGISIWAGCCNPPSCPPVQIFFKAKSKICCCDYQYTPVTTTIPEVCAGNTGQYLFKIKNTCSISTKYVFLIPKGIPIKSINPSIVTLAPGATSNSIIITYLMPTNVNIGSLVGYHFTLQPSNNDPPNCPPNAKTFSAKRKKCPL